MSVLRFPVRYRGKPYTPMKIQRCKKYVEEGKAIWRYDAKLGIRYLKLKVQPSGGHIPEMRLGWDIGSHFCGASVVSPKCHHENFEIVHNRKVKELMTRRRSMRRTRRSKLRHRPVRNHNRTGAKVSNTNQTIFNERKNLVNKILRYYPITKVVVEKVACRNGQQSGWTQVHQGQHQFISWMRSIGLKVSTTKGYVTKNKRVSLFGKDTKVKNKASKTFESHALDSFSIACLGIVQSLRNFRVRKTTKFIQSRGFFRRYLFQFKQKKGVPKQFDKVKDDTWKQYFRYAKGGVKVPFVKMSKLKKIRTLPSGIFVKHTKLWNYQYINPVQCFKMVYKPYGGTWKNGTSKYLDKFKSWIRFDLQIVKPC